MNRNLLLVLCAVFLSACVLFPSMLGFGFGVGWLGARYAGIGLP